MRLNIGMVELTTKGGIHATQKKLAMPFRKLKRMTIQLTNLVQLAKLGIKIARNIYVF